MYIIYCVYNEIILFRFFYFWGFLWYLKNLSLVNTEWTFSVFVSLMSYLGYTFLLDVSTFTTIDNEKKLKINSSYILKDFTQSWRVSFGNSLALFTLNNLNTQKIELHTNSEDISEITAPFCTNFIFDNLSSPFLEHFLFDPNNRPAPLIRFWVIKG